MISEIKYIYREPRIDERIQFFLNMNDKIK